MISVASHLVHLTFCNITIRAKLLTANLMVYVHYITKMLNVKDIFSHYATKAYIMM